MQQENAASGKLEKILGPTAHFCAVEMLFSKFHFQRAAGISIPKLPEQPGPFNIRTQTHVKLTKITSKALKRVLASYPLVAEQIEKTVQVMMTGMVSSIAI